MDDGIFDRNGFQMNDIAFSIGQRAFTWAETALGFAGIVIVCLLVGMLLFARERRERREANAVALERSREIDDKMAELTRLQAEMTGRMQTVAEVFGARQMDFARLVGERIDVLQNNVGLGLESSAKTQTENLSRLNERLAVIDAAQKNLRDLTGEIVNLKDVLANKQARGAYGQGRMEAIIRDNLPPQSYEFQPTLSNRTRPDCLVHLPGDARGLVIDAKFPLESFVALRNAGTDDERTRAASLVKTDMSKHIKDIAEKYLIPGETQDIALMFVPAESVYADLCEHFDDIVQRAHHVRVIVVSPSLLSLAIQVMQSLVRDARVREEAHIIQVEVRKLLADVTRLGERVGKLDAHFRQAQDDVTQIRTSADKIVKRGEKIDALEFDDENTARAELARMQGGATLRAVD